MKITVDFSKPYEEQTDFVKDTFCENDYYEIRSLLEFKRKYKEAQ